MSKEMRPVDRIGLVVLLVSWTLGYPFAVVNILEVVSQIKYAPVNSFFTMAAFAALYALPALIYSLPKVLTATHQKQLAGPVLIGMLLPLALATAPHYINLKLADDTVYEMSLPIEKKSSQRRKPRGGTAYLAYRLHLKFSDTDVGGKILNGEHIVYVSEETFKRIKTRDHFPLKLKKGPMAVFMLQDENTKNIGR